MGMDRRQFARSAGASVFGGTLLASVSDPVDPFGADTASPHSPELRTVAHLKTVNVPEDEGIVRVLGYHEPEDGGGGLFRWDPTGNASEADGGLRIRSEGASMGVWRRQVSDGTYPVTFWGVRGDGKTEERAVIQRALDSHNRLFFPAGTYLVNGSEGQERGEYGGVFPSSDQTLVFDRGAKIKLVEDDGYYSGINLIEVSNVTLLNPHVEGDRSLRGEEECEEREWCEFGHCINIQRGVSDVHIENPKCHDGWGDGLRVNTPDTRLNLTVIGGHLYNNRRNGISVISARSATFHGTYLTSNGGTSPHKGVDVEPNGREFPVQDVQFIGCKAQGHRNAGFSVAFGLADTLNEPASVHFESCVSVEDGRGFLHEYAKEIPGIVSMTDCTVRRPERNGLCVTNWDTSLVVDGLTVYRPNRNDEKDPWRRAGLLVEVNSNNTTTGNVTVSDYVCIGDGQGAAIDIRRFGSRTNAQLRDIVVEGRNRGLEDYTMLSDIDTGRKRVEFDSWEQMGRLSATTDASGRLQVKHGLSKPPNLVQVTPHTASQSIGAVAFHRLETSESKDDTIVFRVQKPNGQPLPNAEVDISWEARFRPY
jgi:hypothetical protein